ncbi:hypothetical protein TorRG33x02_050700 [Trema orientale]|uniref:Uncharacterized protein n=1 Tax=Trema orientale TaxID=63057 RepID=A0A2P5FN73_TREOI|nr:hypothetical protein TorRG33x02_050700 [Trema orientale]
MGLVLGQFGPGSAWQRRMSPNKTPNKMSPRGMRSRDPDRIRIVNGSDYWFSNTQVSDRDKRINNDDDDGKYLVGGCQYRRRRRRPPPMEARGERE